MNTIFLLYDKRDRGLPPPPAGYDYFRDASGEPQKDKDGNYMFVKV